MSLNVLQASPTLEITDAPKQLTITDHEGEKLAVIGGESVVLSGVGLQGPPGPQGEQGPPGLSGSTWNYVYDVPLPERIWTINHPLNGRPSVTVVDLAGSVVIPDVDYVSNSQIIVTHASPIAGHAYLS